MPAPIFEALRQAADPAGHLSYAGFTRLALYHPEHGYYHRQRERVGRNEQSDFYTAASLGGVFADLLLEAIGQLAPAPLESFSLVELGVEAGRGTLAGQAGRFAFTHEIGSGQSMDLPERAIVFANELLDAQPFHRFGFIEGQWREYGVLVGPDGLSEVLLPRPSAEAEEFLATLPPSGEGYRLDISLEAETLLARIARQVRSGLLVFFDYGRSWPGLLEETPAGSARAYHRHEASTDLLARPGEQDLTCHVCWDRLADTLTANAWPGAKLETQEAFFVKHAAPAIERIITAPGNTFDPKKQTLKELIYPGHMGRKFQVMSVCKPDA
ncbi:SAM-dependent methyltransferase [Ruficoccus amylovorans]|uniref:SAM-dependent methyltransferase n=1 Tax=Ruficoccus amylovorans TaxID=1804625 RepID=A0A842HET9_9BACT|nr:SAM-dependent methyltransferase [Ruficoccus amylovorans]MBC2594558.1 SAM-dependent methyltransferase [Ruficoccus amylovorans]